MLSTNCLFFIRFVGDGILDGPRRIVRAGIRREGGKSPLLVVSCVPGSSAEKAHVELHPAMNLDDLKKATPGIEKAVKNYRRIAHAKAA